MHTILLLACFAPLQLPADPLPVREVTVFKDGHAFVLREGDLQPDARGEVVLERLPVPVLGTFWPYAAEGAKLVSATAAQQTVAREKTALDLRQLLEANVGQLVTLHLQPEALIYGTILGIPARGEDELRRLEPRGGPRAPERGSVVLVRTDAGTRAVPIDQVKGITTAGESAPRFVERELRDRLTLRVQREGVGPVRVGLVYVQKGLRWIPAYKIDIDGAGKARVKLEATLVNDLIDLEDAAAHLVIGVPRFEFSGMNDPISLQEVAAQVAAQMRGQDRFRGFLSNAIMSQSASFVEASEAQPGPSGGGGPELTGGESNDDLFVFTLAHVSLKEGERMVVPVTEFELGYRDVYTLEVPFAPPLELRNQWQGDRAAELAQLLAAPKAVHALRIKNGSTAPLTTAPALLLRNGKVISQSLLSYTAIGAETDVPLATAIDVAVEKTETETGRQPDVVRWDGNSFSRTDLAGAVTLVNRKREPIEIEVRRMVLGIADSASGEGKVEQMSMAELWGGSARQEWWGWWNWPYWWHHWNGVARFTWKLRMAPGEKVGLEAKWHYFWR